MWAKMFSVEQDRIRAAFSEALFEASINTSSLDIAQALLEAGIDPNQPIYSSMTGYVERPIQFVADSRPRNIDMATLMLKTGANVDDVTEDNEAPALHITAEHGSLEMIKLLVENSAGIRRWVPAQYSNEPVSGITSLTLAADRSKYIDRKFDDSMTESADKEEAVEPEECESIRILQYLLSLHKNSQDHEIIQDTLTVAAFHGRVDMIELLLAAGANLGQENSLGFTTLETTISQSFETLGAASTVLRLGANPNHFNKLSSLHIIGANCDASFVQLLVEHGADINSSITLVPERCSNVRTPFLQQEASQSKKDYNSSSHTASVCPTHNPGSHMLLSGD
ncbi:hypothetical protein EMCG_06438 [[Emmonsia] crescens]|uniref:Uncharacterized protein n=1 Tax=[Emmonsia] crescens TaxID=73230 RepID=A0A0G2J6T8_9EURO|nr:hypothetical protein EMCG_06438 [Emmonsia crescens UAMH 3008]